VIIEIPSGEPATGGFSGIPVSHGHGSWLRDLVMLLWRPNLKIGYPKSEDLSHEIHVYNMGEVTSKKFMKFKTYAYNIYIYVCNRYNHIYIYINTIHKYTYIIYRCIFNIYIHHYLSPKIPCWVTSHHQNRAWDPPATQLPWPSADLASWRVLLLAPFSVSQCPRHAGGSPLENQAVVVRKSIQPASITGMSWVPILTISYLANLATSGFPNLGHPKPTLCPRSVPHLSTLKKVSPFPRFVQIDLSPKQGHPQNCHLSLPFIT